MSQLDKMVCAFQRSLSGKLFDPDDEAAFRAKIYKNIDPETAKTIIAATNCPNCAMNDIITSINCLPIHFVIKNEIDKDIMKFKDTCR